MRGRDIEPGLDLTPLWLWRCESLAAQSFSRGRGPADLGGRRAAAFAIMTPRAFGQELELQELLTLPRKSVALAPSGYSWRDHAE